MRNLIGSKVHYCNKINKSVINRKKQVRINPEVKYTLKQFEATDRGSNVRSWCRTGAPIEDGVAHMSGYFSQGGGPSDFHGAIPGLTTICLCDVMFMSKSHAMQTPNFKYIYKN